MPLLPAPLAAHAQRKLSRILAKCSSSRRRLVFMQVACLISSILPSFYGVVTCVYISGRPLLSSPREWKIRSGHKNTSDPPGVARSREGGEGKRRVFRRNVRISVGSGKATVALWVSRDVFDFWEHRRARGRRAAVAIRTEGGGGSAPPLPGNRAPSPACGSAVVPATGEPLPALALLFSFVPVLTLATSKVGGFVAFVCVCQKRGSCPGRTHFRSCPAALAARTCGSPRSALPSIALPAALCFIFGPFLGHFGSLVLASECVCVFFFFSKIVSRSFKDKVTCKSIDVFCVCMCACVCARSERGFAVGFFFLFSSPLFFPLCFLAETRVSRGCGVFAG